MYVTYRHTFQMFFLLSPLPEVNQHQSQVAQIVGSSLKNCGNRLKMVGWHASNEPTEAQQFKNTVRPIENNLK